MAVLAQEVTTVVCETQANIDAQEYFLLYGMGSDFEENSYHVWFNKGGSDADPAPSGSTGIECNISGATSASDVGAIVVTQVGGNADFGKAVENLKETQTNIVLSHCPEHRDIIAKQKGNINIDLVLSGHTHGGQITFLGIVPFKPQGSGKYLKGWYKESEPKMYISKGIGTSILPIRFGARAEMVEMEI